MSSIQRSELHQFLPKGVLIIGGRSQGASCIRQMMGDASGDGPQFQLEVSQTLKHGLNRLTHSGIDLILVDMDLPDSHGFKTFLEIAGREPTLPIVVLSHKYDEALALKMIQMGAQDFLVSSEISPRILRSVLQHAIERKKLQQQMIRLSSFAEQSLDPIIEVDLQSVKISYINPAALLKFPDLNDLQLGHPLMEGIMDMGLEVIHGQRRLAREVHHEGNCFEEDISPVVGSSLFRILVKDVSERKKLLKMKDDFMSTVSHELRTPLTIIKGAVSNLEDGILGKMTEIQEKVVRTCSRNIERLGRLINDLLDLSRLEAGYAQNLSRRISLEAVFSKILSDFETVATTKGMDFKIPRIEGHTAIFADLKMLQKAITNLLNNAFQFAKGRVELDIQSGIKLDQLANPPRTADCGSFVQISIKDDGAGIPKEGLQHLFKKFVQINRPMGGMGYKGTGMGLAITWEIMQQLNGQIWAECTEGQGITFHLVIPEYDEEVFVWRTLKAGLIRAEGNKSSLALMVVALKNKEEIEKDCPESEVELFQETLSDRIVNRVLRKSDGLYHYSKMGFIVIMAETERIGTNSVQERIEKVISDYRCVKKNGKKIKPQLSYGVAMYPEDATEAGELMKAATDRTKNGDDHEQKNTSH